MNNTRLLLPLLLLLLLPLLALQMEKKDTQSNYQGFTAGKFQVYNYSETLALVQNPPSPPLLFK